MEDRTTATAAFLDAFEMSDLASLSELLHVDVTWTIPMSFTGNPDDILSIVGREAFLARAEKLSTITSSARFVNRRISVTEDGSTTFVQAQGEFRTVDGKPYRNTYVFRLDWDGNRLCGWEEYANPIAVQKAFALPTLTGD